MQNKLKINIEIYMGKNLEMKWDKYCTEEEIQTLIDKELQFLSKTTVSPNDKHNKASRLIEWLNTKSIPRKMKINCLKQISLFIPFQSMNRSTQYSFLLGKARLIRDETNPFSKKQRLRFLKEHMSSNDCLISTTTLGKIRSIYLPRVKHKELTFVDKLNYEREFLGVCVTAWN